LLFFEISETSFNCYWFLSPAIGVVGDSVDVVVVLTVIVSIVDVNVEAVVVIVETVVRSCVVDCVTVLLVVVGDASVQRMLSRATASTTSVPQYA
jgi:hypothetical protein